MKLPLPLRIGLCGTFATIVLLLLTIGPGLAQEHGSAKKPKPTPSPFSPPKPTPIHAGEAVNHPVDLGSMKLKDGNNLINTSDGVKLSAQVKNGQVLGYGATDSNGHPVNVTVQRKKGGGGDPCPNKCIICTFSRTKSTCFCATCPTRKAQ